MPRGTRSFVVCALGIAAFPLAALSCGGDSNPSSPAAPNGASNPAGAAARLSAADLASSSTPSLSGPCSSIGPGNPGATCGQPGSPALLDEVETAIDLVVQYRPQLFDTSDLAAPNTNLYKVVDPEGYLDTVAVVLRLQGVCSQRDPHDPAYERILAKTSSESSESYDILTSDGYVRRGNGSFVDLCRPASFPIERGPDTPPPGSGCHAPYPPPVTRLACKIHLRSPEFDTLDSTPLVGPDVPYCASIGYTDGRSYCPVRTEGSDDRIACETWRVGTAKDTGRPGPTWTKSDGSYCTGLQRNGCENSPDNQFQLRVFAGGTYQAATADGVSCSVASGR